MTKPVESGLTVPSFTTSGTYSKMVYFWITDYTINTAGEVFHKNELLSEKFSAWDTKVSSYQPFSLCLHCWWNRIVANYDFICEIFERRKTNCICIYNTISCQSVFTAARERKYRYSHVSTPRMQAHELDPGTITSDGILIWTYEAEFSSVF